MRFGTHLSLLFGKSNNSPNIFRICRSASKPHTFYVHVAAREAINCGNVTRIGAPHLVKRTKEPKLKALAADQFTLTWQTLFILPILYYIPLTFTKSISIFAIFLSERFLIKALAADHLTLTWQTYFVKVAAGFLIPKELNSPVIIFHHGSLSLFSNKSGSNINP